MRLKSKVALVVGGASGIGASISREAAAEGALVIVADSNFALAEAVAATLPGARALRLDVTDAASLEAAVEAAVEAASGFGGGIDVLFNSAAIWAMEPVLETTRAEFEKLFSVNVVGLFFTLQAVARRMVATGRGGSIVNIASQAGRRGESASAVYAATKASVISLTQSAALALIEHKIRVNAIAPGNVDTPMWERVDAAFARRDGIPVGEKTRQVVAAIPFGRMARPEEVAKAAVFLASDDAEYIVGQTLNVDGGNVLS